MKKYGFSGLLILLGTVCFAQTYSLYGYENGRYGVFLGTFQVRGNTIYEDKYGSNSIFNEYGTYGSEYSSTSIWNNYSTWGSEYSSTSATNSYCQNPPAIVDEDGDIVGYLTANRYLSNTNFGKSVSRYFGLQR
jgi:hypothetical protein